MKVSEIPVAERIRVETAMHEAGHAVLAALAGATNISAKVQAGSSTPGFTTYDNVAAYDEAAIAWAGSWAEARWKHGPKPTQRQIAVALSRNGGDAAAIGLVASAGIPSRESNILENCWPSIAALARRLYVDGSVDHATVLAALGFLDRDRVLPSEARMIRTCIKSPRPLPTVTQ